MHYTEKCSTFLNRKCVILRYDNSKRIKENIITSQWEILQKPQESQERYETKKLNIFFQTFSLINESKFLHSYWAAVMENKRDYLLNI